MFALQKKARFPLSGIMTLRYVELQWTGKALYVHHPEWLKPRLRMMATAVLVTSDRSGPTGRFSHRHITLHPGPHTRALSCSLLAGSKPWPDWTMARRNGNVPVLCTLRSGLGGFMPLYIEAGRFEWNKHKLGEFCLVRALCAKYDERKFADLLGNFRKVKTFHRKT